MVSGLCEGYHWSYEQAMGLTMPQAIMLNHAAWVSRTNSERKYEAKREAESKENKGVIATPEEAREVERVQKLSPEKLSEYMSQGWS